MCLKCVWPIGSFRVFFSFFFSQNFLMLEEVGSAQDLGLPVAEKKDCMVEIKDLICFWNKVGKPISAWLF